MSQNPCGLTLHLILLWSPGSYLTKYISKLRTGRNSMQLNIVFGVSRDLEGTVLGKSFLIRW